MSAACSNQTSAPAPRAEPAVTVSSGGPLTWRNVPDADVAETSGGLYLAWVSSPLGRARVEETLARVGSSSGRVDSMTSILGNVLALVWARGSLYVTTRAAGVENLVRLDPLTLSERGRRRLGEGMTFSHGSMAVAGGALWTAIGNHLLRVSLGDPMGVTSIALPGASSADVATDSSGSVLLVSVADPSGSGQVERRDPDTGRLLGSSPAIGGIVDPYVQGIVGNDFWVSESTGNMGFVRLYRLDTLTPSGPGCDEGRSNLTCIVGTNDISARLTAGRLWVTQDAGGRARNFCGDPGGAVSAPLPVTSDEQVLTIGTMDLFVQTQLTTPRAPWTVKEIPLPEACRGSLQSQPVAVG